jgi:hypothetical protein
MVRRDRYFYSTLILPKTIEEKVTLNYSCHLHSTFSCTSRSTSRLVTPDNASGSLEKYLV